MPETVKLVGIVPVGGKALRLFGSPKYLLASPRNGFLLKDTIQSLFDEGATHVIVPCSNNNERLVRAALEGMPQLRKIKILPKDTPTVGAAVVGACEEARTWVGASSQIYFAFAMPDVWTEQIPSYFSVNLRLNTQALVSCWKQTWGIAQGLGVVSYREDEMSGALYLDAVYDKPKVMPPKFGLQRDASASPYEKVFPIWGTISWRDSLCNFLSDSHTHMGMFLEALLEANHRVRVREMGGHYFDVGTPLGLSQYSNFLASCYSEED